MFDPTNGDFDGDTTVKKDTFSVVSRSSKTKGCYIASYDGIPICASKNPKLVRKYMHKTRHCYDYDVDFSNREPEELIKLVVNKEFGIYLTNCDFKIIYKDWERYMDSLYEVYDTLLYTKMVGIKMKSDEVISQLDELFGQHSNTQEIRFDYLRKFLQSHELSHADMSTYLAMRKVYPRYMKGLEEY